MMKKSVGAVAVVTCILAVLGTAGVAAAVDAPKWVAAIYVEAQKVVGLRWVPVPGASAYKVLRTVTAGKDEKELGTASSPQYMDTSVEPGATYYYTLKAVAGAEIGPASEAKAVAIPGVKTTGVETPDMASAEVQVTVEFGKPTYKIGVIWRGKGPAIAFNLYRSLEKGKQGEMVSSSQDQRYVDVNVEAGKTYYYTVTALDAAFQETKPSAEKAVEVKVYVPPVEEPAAVAETPTSGKRRELPKLVPIPTKRGELIRLPGTPWDIDCTNDGTIYIAASRLYRSSWDGSGMEDITPEGIQQILNVGVGLDDDILVTISNNTAFAVIRGRKATIYEIPALEQGLKSKDGRVWPPRPSIPNDVTQNIDGKYWVTEGWNNRVAIFDERGKFLHNAEAGTEEELVVSPTFIDHDSKGNVFVVSGADNQIKIYDAEGKLTGMFGETGNIAGSFARVQGIFVDKEDRLWIVDMINGTVQKFDTTGELLGVLSGADGKSGLNLQTPNSVVVLGKEALVCQGINSSVVPLTIQ